MKPLVLGLGNEIVSDDGFGPAVARRLLEEDGLRDRAEIVSAALAGFALLDLLQDRPRALVIDVIHGTGQPAGTLHSFPADTLAPTHNLVSSHQMSLPVALKLGRALGYCVPDTVDILACEAADLVTLHEGLTTAVAGAVDGAVDWVRGWILLEYAERGGQTCTGASR